MFRNTVLVTLLSFLSYFVFAQQLLNDKINIHTGSDVYMQNAVIYLPVNYTTNRKYPLVIYCHGIGEAGSDISNMYTNGLPQVLRNGYKPSFNFIMIAPQRGSYSIDPNWLQGILADAIKRYPIDESRIYLTGIDAGGWPVYGSQLNISSDFAKKFAAIVLCSGAGQDANKENLNWWKKTKTPLWSVVGNNDISYRDQNNFLVDEINKWATGAAVLTIRNDVSHGGWNDVYKGAVKVNNLTMWQWISQFKRVNGDIVVGNPVSDSSPAKSPPPPPPPPPPSNNPPPPPPNGKYANYVLTSKESEIWLPKGLNIPNLRPGDTVNIPAGNYNLIELGSFKGDAAHPIIIRNLNGLVTVKDFRLSNTPQYFKLLGNGKPGLSYGIKISGNTGTGLSAFASDFEIAYIEVDGSGAGIYIKKNPEAGNPVTQYPNYVMRNIYLHHNYIHNTHNEGMYIGHTYPGGDPYDNGMVPVRLANVEIAFNRVENTGWDGIQLSNATYGAKIHDNTVANFGMENKGGQQAGIILGANTTGDIYNNVIKKGTGNGIEAFGYGTSRIYNNTIENTGDDGTDNGQESVFCNDLITSPEQNPRQKMLVYNNTIRHPKPKAGIRVSGYNNNSDPATIQNNKFKIKKAKHDWEKYYIFSVEGSTITNNTLIEGNDNSDD